jgi:hypothetical protein
MQFQIKGCKQIYGCELVCPKELIYKEFFDKTILMPIHLSRP